MKLHQDHQEFRNPRVFYPDPKAVELDRVMVNLFALLTTDGHEIVTGRSRMTVSAQKVAFQAEEFRKLDGNDVPETELEAIRGWLDADVFDVVNRGKGEAVAAIASLRPLHLDAAKFRVAKQCRDYNVADHLYACLSHGDASTLKAAWTSKPWLSSRLRTG